MGERRLAGGDMTVTARFTGVPDTVTKDIIESKASDIQAAINTRLTGITISGLSVIATDTLAPTPAPAPFLAPTPSDAGTGSGAFGARLDVSAAAVLLALLCRGHAGCISCPVLLSFRKMLDAAIQMPEESL